jgi:hypothetical protein
MENCWSLCKEITPQGMMGIGTVQVSLDESHVIFYVDDNLCEKLGYFPYQVQGQSIRILAGPSSNWAFNSLEVAVNIELYDSSGNSHDFVMTCCPNHCENGILKGYDITLDNSIFPTILTRFHTKNIAALQSGAMEPYYPLDIENQHNGCPLEAATQTACAWVRPDSPPLSEHSLVSGYAPLAAFEPIWDVNGIFSAGAHARGGVGMRRLGGGGC